MRKLLELSLAWLLCAGSVFGQALYTESLTVTNSATSIVVHNNVSSVIIRENSANCSAVYSVTPLGQATAVNEPACAAFQFLAGGDGHSFYSSGQTLGTIVATTAGPFTFIMLEWNSSVPVLAVSAQSVGALPFNPSAPLVGFNTTAIPGTDRCAAIKSQWSTLVGSLTAATIAPINSIGEVVYQDASQHIPCGSNPFPVSSNYGGTDAENGGVFWLPDSALFTTQGLQLGISTAQVYGLVAGNQLVQGTDILANSSGWSNNTSGCAGGGAICKTYNPFVFAYGATVGYSSTVSASSPQTTTVQNVGFGMPSGGIIPGVGAISMCSGEENVHAAFFGIRIFNPYSTGMQVGCGTILTQDAEVVDGLYLTKPAAASVPDNTTPATISKWWADTSGRVLAEFSNSPSATLGCGMTVNLSGVSTGGGGVSINGVHQIAGMVDSSNNLLLCSKQAAGISSANFDGTGKQFIFIQNTSTSDSCTSSCGSGTTGFFATGMDINGQDGRAMHNITLTSNITSCNSVGGFCTGNAPYTELAISGIGWHLEDIHVEEGTDGITVGLEQATSAITLINVYPTTNLVNAVHLSNNFGAVKNFTAAMSCVNTLGAGSNTMLDDFNHNTLTGTNNPCITYSTGGTGTVGDVMVSNAGLCSEMTNGWCQQGADKAYYSGGVKQIDCNGATGNCAFLGTLSLGSSPPAPNGTAVIAIATGTCGTGASNVGLFCFDSNTGAPRFNQNNGTSQGLPQTVMLTSQYTNSTTGFTNVTGTNSLAFSAAANTNYLMTCTLYYQAASTGGLNIEFTGPASPTNITYSLLDPGSATTLVNASVATAYSTSLGAVVTTATTNFPATVTLSLQNGANAGTVQMLAKSSAAVQLQIQTGSFCTWQTQ